MSNIKKSLTELIGNTPLVELTNYNQNNNLKATIVAKLESFNPLGSAKDRIGYAMIKSAFETKKINEQTTIIEPTSGNTGIGLAFVCATYRLKLVLTMPETMSVERMNLLKALGAELVLTEGALGMKGAIAKAVELAQATENSFIPQQFENPANPQIHRETTGLEIIRDTDGDVDVFIAGVGTGGTITGVGEVLKKNNPNVRIIAVEPLSSAVLSGEKPGSHKIQGIGAGFIPKTLNTEVYDEVIKVANDDAFKASSELAKSDGILCGISSGAALFAATQVAKRSEFEGKRIVVLLPDTGERYLSTDLYK
ncbi:MAG: cysteine synthase A [Oscillospiraceae bacterium]